MSHVEMSALLEVGMHFGHLTRRWNPKMKPFIYGVRNGIHIIDLSKTVRQLNEALSFIVESVGNGADVLFVGTKKQAQDIIREEAVRCKMYYINQRWLGGTLTNWRTIKSSIDRLNNLEKKKNDGTFSELGKKELLMIDREIGKLMHSLGGIRDLTKPPGLMVIIDPRLERIALHEAKVLGIPVVALADTNCDPDPIDFLVCGNDDALKSIKLFLTQVADKVLEGLQLREVRVRKAADEKEEGGEKPAVREVAIEPTEKRATYVATRDDASEESEAASGAYSAKAEVEAKPTEEVAPTEGEAPEVKADESSDKSSVARSAEEEAQSAKEEAPSPKEDKSSVAPSPKEDLSSVAQSAEEEAPSPKPDEPKKKEEES